MIDGHRKATVSTEAGLLGAALELHKGGYSVIPARPRSKEPLVKWEVYQTRTSTEDEIHGWWTRWPDANPAIVCGEVSGRLFVVDTENHDLHRKLKEALERHFGPIPSVSTGRGGHLYFLFPAGSTVRAEKLVKWTPPGTEQEKDLLEIRGAGNYVVAAGAVHPNGSVYEWEHRPFEPSEVGDSEWLLAYLRQAGEMWRDGFLGDGFLLGGPEKAHVPAFERSPRAEARQLLTEGRHWDAIMEALDALHAGDDDLKTLVFCVCLTSGMKEKLHFMAVGDSQSGKSHLEFSMAPIFLNMEIYDSQSPRYLLYQVKEAGSHYLRGKIIVLEEAQDYPETWGMLKDIAGADKERVTHGTVVNGKALSLEIEGLPVILTNSVQTPTDKQVNNRFVIGNVDESEEQDERIRGFQNDGVSGLVARKRERDIALGRAVVAEILAEQDVDVLVPSARFIDFPMKRPRIMRLQFLRLVKAVCYANRFLRRKIGDAYVATEDDVRTAYGFWRGIQELQQVQLNETASKVLKAVPHDRYEAQRFILERLGKAGVKESNARRTLKRLYSQDLVDERRATEDWEDEEGNCVVQKGWSLEYKRMAGDLEMYDGSLSKGSTSSPLRGEESERESAYIAWAVALSEGSSEEVNEIVGHILRRPRRDTAAAAKVDDKKTALALQP